MSLVLLIFKHVEAFATCEALLENRYHVEGIVSRISQTMGVTVARSQKVGQHATTLGTFDAATLNINMIETQSVRQDLINLHHESVHATSLLNARENPTAQNLALLIVLKSDEVLDPNLPENYRSSFILDEIKAQYKTALYLASMTRFDYRGYPPNVQRSSNADWAYQKSSMLRKTSINLIEELQKYVESELAHSRLPAGWAIFPMYEHMPQHFFFAIPVSTKTINFTAYVPVYFPEIKYSSESPPQFQADKLLTQFFDVTDAALSFANQQKAPPRIVDRP